MQTRGLGFSLGITGVISLITLTVGFAVLNSRSDTPVVTAREKYLDAPQEEVVVHDPLRAQPGHSEWEVLRGCELVPKATNDGDTFDIKYGGGQILARLYFADAVELVKTRADALEKQSQYFGISSEHVLQIGEDARDFSQRMLSKPFKLFTKWEKKSAGSPHYLVMILVEDDKGELRFLQELLVERGLALITEPSQEDAERKMDELPDGSAPLEFFKNLHVLEDDAIKGKIGGWRRN